MPVLPQARFNLPIPKAHLRLLTFTKKLKNGRSDRVRGFLIVSPNGKYVLPPREKQEARDYCDGRGWLYTEDEEFKPRGKLPEPTTPE